MRQAGSCPASASDEIEDVPQNGGGEREVEPDHPFEQTRIDRRREMLRKLLAERGGHGFGLLVRQAGLFEPAGEAKGIYRGRGHGVSNCGPSRYLDAIGWR